MSMKFLYLSGAQLVCRTLLPGQIELFIDYRAWFSRRENRSSRRSHRRRNRGESCRFRVSPFFGFLPGESEDKTSVSRNDLINRYAAAALSWSLGADYQPGVFVRLRKSTWRGGKCDGNGWQSAYSGTSRFHLAHRNRLACSRLPWSFF